MSLLVINQIIAGQKTVPHTVTIPAAVMAFVLTAAWIGVNASPERSMNRFERILSYQEHLRDYAYETLATTYYHHGRLPDAIRAQEIATTISENPRRHFTLARYYKEYGDLETSFQVLEYIVEHHPRFRPARQTLVAALFQRGRFDEVIEVAGRGIQGDAREPAYYYYIGMSLVRLGRIEDGKAALLVAQQLQPDPPLSEAIAAELRRLETGDAAP
jgi:tetratricopeptide (TPR) repeat protein